MEFIKTLRGYLDKKLLFIIVIFYTTFTLISMLQFAYHKHAAKIYQDKWSDILVDYALDYVLIILYMAVILIITKYMVVKKYSWLFMITVHSLLSILLGFYIFASISFLKRVFNISSSYYTFDSIFQSFAQYVDITFLIYFSLVGIFHTYFYLLKMKETEIQQVKLEENLIKSELKGLKSQIQPHFLFNTLNNIHSLIDIDVNKSKTVIVDLGILLRNMIDYNSENLIRLKDEIILLKKYLNIIDLRFSDSLEIIEDIDYSNSEALVPSMLIQSFIENSIKHGYSSEHEEIKIFITIKRQGDFLHIKIENTGKKLEVPSDQVIHNGSGINNVVSRLKIIYHDNFDFDIGNSDLGVAVNVKVPYRE